MESLTLDDSTSRTPSPSKSRNDDVDEETDPATPARKKLNFATEVVKNARQRARSASVSDSEDEETLTVARNAKISSRNSTPKKAKIDNKCILTEEEQRLLLGLDDQGKYSISFLLPSAIP